MVADQGFLIFFCKKEEMFFFKKKNQKTFASPEGDRRACGGGPAALALGSVLRIMDVPVVEVFTQPWCPYCARAVNLLNSKGVAFTEINAPHGTPEREASISRSGGRSSVPQIFINGTPIGGSDELAALERAGKLDALLAG